MKKMLDFTPYSVIIVVIVLLTINFICALLVYIGENNDLQQYTS